MLNDIEGAHHNVKRIKGGLSIFDDEQIREHYLSKTNVPIMQKYHLSSNFQKVILNPIKNKNEDLSSQLRHINNSSSVGAASFLPGSLDLHSLASSFQNEQHLSLPPTKPHYPLAGTAFQPVDGNEASIQQINRSPMSSIDRSTNYNRSTMAKSRN